MCRDDGDGKIAVLVPTLGAERAGFMRRLRANYEGSGIRVYSSDRGRMIDALWECFMRSSEPYVVFSGDDDFHCPAGLRKVIEAMEKFGADSGYGAALLWGVEQKNGGQMALKWSVTYPIVQEGIFYVHRRSAFEQGLEFASLVKGRDRAAMNQQGVAFTRGSVRGPVAVATQVQLIHCDHAGRGQVETPEHAMRRAVERWGGGWLASWLPSRQGSLRAIHRKSSPYYTEAVRVRRILEAP